MRQIRRLQVQRRIDSKKIDRCIHETRARAECAAQNGRTGNHVRELPANAHDFIRVGDSFKVLPASNSRVRTLGWHDRALLAWLKPRPDDERSVGSESRADEVLGEALCLSLSADKKGYAEHDAAEA